MSKPIYYMYLICPLSADGKAEGPCKIGISRNPAGRLRTLQTAWPRKLIIYELWDFPKHGAAREAEEMMHYAFAQERAAGEWFNVEPKDAMWKVTIWFHWAAKATAGIDADALPGIPETGVGMVANGRASQLGKLISHWNGSRA